VRADFWELAERQAISYRNAVRLKAYSPLPARTLASHLDITILRPENVPGITDDMLRRLLRTYRSVWSAFALPFDECTIIIHNTTHRPGRQETNLMHEWRTCCASTGRSWSCRRRGSRFRPEASTENANAKLPPSGRAYSCRGRPWSGRSSAACQSRRFWVYISISRPMLQWRLHQTGLWAQAAPLN